MTHESLQQSRPSVRAFYFDNVNEEHMWRHRITPQRLRRTLRNKRVVVPNRKQRAALWLYLAYEDDGTCLAAPIVPTNNPTLWRPITAYLVRVQRV